MSTNRKRLRESIAEMKPSLCLSCLFIAKIFALFDFYRNYISQKSIATKKLCRVNFYEHVVIARNEFSNVRKCLFFVSVMSISQSYRMI